MFSVFRNNSYKYFSEKLRGFSCFWCRIDRKRCDKKHPACSRCVKFNLDCKPYETEKKTKNPSNITKSAIGVNRCYYLLKRDSDKNIGYNTLTYNLFLSRYNSISAGASIDFNSKYYSKFMSLISLSFDVVILKDINDYSDRCLTINNQDHTISPSFWDKLLKFYFTEAHIFHPLFSLSNYSMGNEYWIRTNIIFCYVYQFSDLKSPKTNIKMDFLLRISENSLNRYPPSLLSLQCHILLCHLYRAIGNLKKKNMHIYQAIKMAHVIGLTKKCSKISLQNQYERYLCYIVLIEIYWANSQHSTDMGLLLDFVDIWPDFSLNWQVIDPIRSSEHDLAIANNINIKTKFAYFTQIYINKPFADQIEKGKIDTKFLTQLELKLDNCYSDINKKLKPGPYLDNIIQSIKFSYLLTKLQLNLVLLKTTGDVQFQVNYIKLSYDIIRIISNPYSKIDPLLVAVHFTLKSAVKNISSISQNYYHNLNDLISIMTNMLNNSTSYKLVDNKN